MEGLEHVEAPLNYLVPSTEKPAFYMYEPSPGTPRQTAESDRHTMAIHDGRKVLESLSLDEQGFTLAHHDSGVSNFYDKAEVRAVYYPEVEQLVKKATGASKVLVFDHNVRCEPMAERGENGAQRPVKSAHNDYTLKSGPQRVRDLVEPAEAERLLEQRFAVINVWKPIVGPVEEMPLAVCDAKEHPQTGSRSDRPRVPETGPVRSTSSRFSPEHRWFYFPKMQPTEVMLLKCYDSAEDGRARFSAHSAFLDPTSPPDAAPRESIEVRTLAFFAPAE